MSQIRDPAYITEQGRTMMTAGGDVTYTKAVLYGQDISHLTADQVQALTSIGSPLKQVPIGVSDKQSNGKDTTVVLEATFQNDGLTADLPYTAVGFYGKRGNDNEKLIIVAVANAGAYLAATRPDGVATDALDLKVAIAIGDATNVTAVVDPAASVTPATLNGAINETKQVLTALIDTKASQSNLDQTNAEVAKKADSEAVNSQLATKANTTDIDKQVKTLNDAINTKADKATVDAEIAKIDFTPYAKTADVSEQIKAVSDEVATKVGADYSYSKAQLDEKLLALSTDTNGKVSADQVTALIADKANKADVDKSFKAVNDSLATKADQATTYSKTDVDKLLNAKDDTTDVDAKINSNVTKLNQAINTKANASDVYTKPQMDTAFGQRDAKIGNNTNVINTINEALKSLIPDDTHAPALPAGFDLNNYFVGWRRSVNTTLKNMPFGWLNYTMYFQGTVAGSDGRFELALYIGDGSNTNPKIAYRFYGWGNWKPWVLLADNGDISNLQNQITNATNLANQASQKVDSTLANSFVRKQGMNANGDLVEIRGNATKQTNGGYAFDFWSSDWTASKLKDVLNALPGKASTTDVANANNNANGRLPLGGGNMTLRSTINWNGGGINDRTGNIGGLHWEGGTDRVDLFADQDGNDNLDLVIQLGDDNSNSVVIRNASGAQVARIDAGGNITSPTITTLQNQVNDLINQINYIKANYVEGRTFPASQEAQAAAWENEKPTRLAMIEK